MMPRVGAVESTAREGTRPLAPTPESTVVRTRLDRNDRADLIGHGSLTALGVGGLVMASRLAGLGWPSCPLLTNTGVPCPLCGMTRLAVGLTSGDVGGVLAADAAGVLFLVLILLLGCVYIVQRCRRPAGSPALLRWRALPWLLGGLLLIHWVNTLTRGFYLPV